MADAAGGEARSFQLGIIGGCMSHQVGIAMGDLYHRRLADAVETDAGIRVRVHVAREFGSAYATRLDALLARQELDGVLLHLRVTIFRRAPLFIHPSAGGRVRRVLNPVLFDRRHHGDGANKVRALEWADRAATARADRAAPARADERLAERASSPDRRHSNAVRGRLGLGRLNWWLGALVGLDRWAVDNEMVVLEEFIAACKARNLPVFVLGPTPLDLQESKSRVPRMLTERLRAYAGATATHVALLDAKVDADDRPLVLPDGMHLTREGHAFVAGRLRDAGMAAWMASIAARPGTPSGNSAGLDSGDRVAAQSGALP